MFYFIYCILKKSEEKKDIPFELEDKNLGFVEESMLKETNFVIIEEKLNLDQQISLKRELKDDLLIFVNQILKVTSHKDTHLYEFCIHIFFQKCVGYSHTSNQN